MAYKGDTPAKKLARLEAWWLASDTLGERFSQGRHLFLAGPTCADASVAIGLGARPERLVAVDQDEQAAASAQWRWPELSVQHAHVRSVLGGERFDFANLDFCAQMLDENLDTAAATIVNGLHDQSVIAVTLQAGREMPKDGPWHGRVLASRAFVQANLDRMFADTRARWEPLLPALSRYPVVHAALVARTRHRGKVPVPLAFLFYRSKGSGDNHGMSMCVYLAQVFRCSTRANDPHLTAALQRQPEFRFVDPAPGDLGRRVVALEAAGYDAGMLLDLTRSTIAAYKANVTRSARIASRTVYDGVTAGFWPAAWQA